jgi:hypothetical protein
VTGSQPNKLRYSEQCNTTTQINNTGKVNELATHTKNTNIRDLRRCMKVKGSRKFEVCRHVSQAVWHKTPFT